VLGVPATKSYVRFPPITAINDPTQTLAVVNAAPLTERNGTDARSWRSFRGHNYMLSLDKLTFNKQKFNETPHSISGPYGARRPCRPGCACLNDYSEFGGNHEALY